jgi:hypothetical protein
MFPSFDGFRPTRKKEKTRAALSVSEMSPLIALKHAPGAWGGCRIPPPTECVMTGCRQRAAQYPPAVPIFNFLIQSVDGMERSRVNPLDPAAGVTFRGTNGHLVDQWPPDNPHSINGKGRGTAKYSNFRVNSNLTLGNLSIGVAGNSPADR